MFQIHTFPTHLLIIGGSYVGLEFAQTYRRFASRVTVVERASRLLGREDSDVSEGILDIRSRDGVEIHLSSDCISVGKEGEEIAVRATCDGVNSDLRGSHLLLALGRRPNTDDLGLENTGVRRDQGGHILVDDELRTAVAGIWALGECNGRGAFMNTSYNDYEIVAANLLDGEQRSLRDRMAAYGLYVDPPLGGVGMTDAEVLRSGRPALIGKRPMTEVGRAVENGETQGFIKIVVDAEFKRILGAAILATGGDEAIHCIIVTMDANAPYTTLQRAVHIHPTVSELIPTVLGKLEPLARTAGAAA
jgi:pyruvate/2-oxoglutarate dehydrogenase complex dihydrolipoamide dehydrogenase (E3) component